MNTSIPGAVLLVSGLLLTGCDSKSQNKSQNQQSVDDKIVQEFEAYSAKNKERMSEQLDSEDSVSNSTDSIDEYLEISDKVIDQASPELAAQLESQAMILRQVKDLLAPFIDADNKLYEVGGINAASLVSVEDINSRIALIEHLSALNDSIDAKFPELFNQIVGADSPQGVAQIKLAKDLRKLNRELYPHMIESLKIVRQYWATSGNANDGNFYFGDDVPDEAVAQYNQHLQAIDTIGQQQVELQRDYYNNP